MITNILTYNIQQLVATLEDFIFSLQLYTPYSACLWALGEDEEG